VMGSEYSLIFDLSRYQELDNFALLARQDYNLGNKGGWLGHFRGGLYGFYARLTGVEIHYHQVHSWDLIASGRNPIHLAEYHLSSILFNMDSALECMVFALNALGYSVESTQFLDVAKENTLRQVTARNILGRRSDTSKGIVPGYGKYFPSLKSHWQENRSLIQTIEDHHSVSKHRQTVFTGGRKRDDPPPGLLRALGTGHDVAEITLMAPWAEVNLKQKPRTFAHRPEPIPNDGEIVNLEELAMRFCDFTNACSVKALEDAQTTIKLKRDKL